MSLWWVTDFIVWRIITKLSSFLSFFLCMYHWAGWMSNQARALQRYSNVLNRRCWIESKRPICGGRRPRRRRRHRHRHRHRNRIACNKVFKILECNAWRRRRRKIQTEKDGPIVNWSLAVVVIVVSVFHSVSDDNGDSVNNVGMEIAIFVFVWEETMSDAYPPAWFLPLEYQRNSKRMNRYIFEKQNKRRNEKENKHRRNRFPSGGTWTGWVVVSQPSDLLVRCRCLPCALLLVFFHPSSPSPTPSLLPSLLAGFLSDHLVGNTHDAPVICSISVRPFHQVGRRMRRPCLLLKCDFKLGFQVAICVHWKLVGLDGSLFLEKLRWGS